MTKANTTTEMTGDELAVLRGIVAEYDAAVEVEPVRWGDESAAGIARRGVFRPIGQRKDRKVLHGLVARGLLRMTTRAQEVKIDRRGAFGRRLGGTRTETHTSAWFAPTTAASSG